MTLLHATGVKIQHTSTLCSVAVEEPLAVLEVVTIAAPVRGIRRSWSSITSVRCSGTSEGVF